MGSLSFLRKILDAAKTSTGRSLVRSPVHAHLIVNVSEDFLNIECPKAASYDLARLVLRFTGAESGFLIRIGRPFVYPIVEDSALGVIRRLFPLIFGREPLVSP